MRYRFAGVELDESQYELRRDGVLLHVEPRVLDLLIFLIRNRDRVVPREELLDTLWKEKFIGEAALTRCVMEARKVIAVEGQEDPIRTVHRRGYRFVAAVTETPSVSETIELESAAAAPAPVETEIAPPSTQPATPAEHAETAPSIAASDRRSSPRVRRAAIIGGAVAVGSALVWLTTAGFAPFEPETAVATTPAELRVASDLKITRLTTSGKAVDAAISPDGRFVAYIVNDSGTRSIRMRQVATGSDTELVAGVPRPRKALTFTPDGSYVAFLEHHTQGGWAIHRVAALGGVPQRWIESVSDSPWSKGKEIDFASDGRHVAYIRSVSPDRTALFVSNLETSQERQLAMREGALFRPLWTDDGKALLCHWKLPGYSTDIRLLEIPLRSPERARELPASGVPLFVAQSLLPDQRHVIGVGGRSLSGGAIYLAAYPSMKLTPITQGIGHWHSLSVAADGRRLVVVREEENYNLWTAEEGDGAGRQLTFDVDAMEGIHGIAVRPDGEFVYTSRTNGEHNHVWISSPDGRRVRQLTSGEEDEFWPVLAPSGETVFYGQRRTVDKRTMRLWRMDVASGRATQLTHGNWDMLPAVTPDGRWLFYTDGGGETPVMKRVETTGGAPRTVAPGIMFAPAISPDGTLVAGFFAGSMSDGRKLVVMKLETGEVVERFAVEPRTLCVRWMPDGRGLVVARGEGGADNLWVYPRGGGDPRQITHFRSLAIGSFNLLPGGRQFVLSRGQEESDVIMIADVLQ